MEDDDFSDSVEVRHPSRESLRVSISFLMTDPGALIHERTPDPARLRRIALPLVLENALMLLVGWSDSILAGQVFGKDRYLASVAVGSQLLFFVTAVAGLISVGVGGLVARRIGASRPAKANELVVQAILLAFLFGVALAVLTLLGAPHAVTLLGLSPKARPLAEQYLRLVALCFPMILVQHACLSCLSSSGTTWVAILIDYHGRALLNGLAFPGGGWRLHRR